MSLAMNLNVGDLTTIYGIDPDWHGHIGTGIVVEIRKHGSSWTDPLEALVLVNSKCSWFDTKHFMFCEPEHSI